MRRILKWLLWIALAFLVYAIFQSPVQAADIVVTGFEGIGAGFAAVFSFFDAILQRLGGGAAAG